MLRSENVCAKCFVPSCPNTTTNSPRKVFVVVSERVKNKWCRQLNINYASRRMYCCEDHLNLEEDLENYMYWKMMKGKAILKSTAKLRNISSCALNTRDVEQENLPMSSNATFKNTEIEIPQSLEEPQAPALKALLLQPIENLSVAKSFHTRSTLKSTSTSCMRVDTAIQCTVKMVDKSTNKAMKRTKQPVHVSPSQSSNHTTSATKTSSNPSLFGSTTETESQTNVVRVEKFVARQQTMQFIYKNPKAYIGLPKQYIWLINYIISQSKTDTKELDILIALIKLKLNDTATRICDQFELSNVTYTKSLYCGIQVLASFFQNLIYMPSPREIKKNLPLVFKIRYPNVQIIIDACEIEIEKPHNPMRQAQTWSQYKNGNTVKYLIGCTPNGFVSYISKGYGGRISDKALVEKSNFIDILSTNSVIMADRGFMEIESLLVTKGVKLLRPPSVYCSTKPTKDEVIQTKVIASLRVHIERVIRRVREFRFLKPHSVVSHKNVGFMDHMVVIACGLINLQSEIIKRK